MRQPIANAQNVRGRTSAPVLPVQADSLWLRGSGNAPAWVLYLVLTALMAFDATAMFIHFLRISGSEEIGHLSKAFTAIAIAASAATGLVYGFRNSFSYAAFVLLITHGFTGAILHEYDLDYHFWGHVYYWLIMAFGFHIGRTVQVDVKNLEWWFLRLSQLVLVGSALGYMNLESYRSAQQGSVYNGYAGDQLLLPMAIFASLGHPLQALASFLLILLSSRRGPLAAAILAVIVVYVAKRNKRLWVASLMTALPLVLVGWAAMHAVRYVAHSDAFSPDSAIVRVAAKWDTFLDYEEDLTAATSGRDEEVEGAMLLIWESPYDWWTGHGFGWEIASTEWHFVHLSYLNYFVTHGFLVGSIQILLILYHVNRTHHSAMCGGKESRLLWAALMYQIAALVLSFTCAWLLISFLFWLIIGFGSRRREVGAAH
jgi:hypothetical protein